MGTAAASLQVSRHVVLRRTCLALKSNDVAGSKANSSAASACSTSMAAVGAAPTEIWFRGN